MTKEFSKTVFLKLPWRRWGHLVKRLKDYDWNQVTTLFVKSQAKIRQKVNLSIPPVRWIEDFPIKCDSDIIFSACVVIAFFVCWAPFHAQRLLYVVFYDHQWKFVDDEFMRDFFSGPLLYVTGCLYYFSSTVNPILYNLLSRKYRWGTSR